MGVAVLTAAVGGQACTWEGWEEPQQLRLSLPLSRLAAYACRSLEGQTKKPNGPSGWATGLPHSPPAPHLCHPTINLPVQARMRGLRLQR